MLAAALLLGMQADARHGCRNRESIEQTIDSSGASPGMRRTRNVEKVRESTFSTARGGRGVAHRDLSV